MFTDQMPNDMFALASTKVEKPLDRLDVASGVDAQTTIDPKEFYEKAWRGQPPAKRQKIEPIVIQKKKPADKRLLRSGGVAPKRGRGYK